MPVRAVALSVGKRTTERASLGKRDIYELLNRPDDDSFQIREKVLAESLHFEVRVEYTPDGKACPPSEVIGMNPQPCARRPHLAHRDEKLAQERRQMRFGDVSRV